MDQQPFARRLFEGSVPIAVVLFLLYLWSINVQSGDVIPTMVVFAMAATILWLGWGRIRKTVPTKLVGILVSLLVGIVVVAFALSIAIHAMMILFVVFIFGLPFILYEFLVRLPNKTEAGETSGPNDRLTD